MSRLLAAALQVSVQHVVLRSPAFEDFVLFELEDRLGGTSASGAVESCRYQNFSKEKAAGPVSIPMGRTLPSGAFQRE